MARTVKKNKIVIVGAGMSGLTCAHYLRKSGFKVTLVEASDRVGGRLRTEVFAGYRLDHGFQVLLTSYPEAKRVLNYQRLNLHEFFPSAVIHYRGHFFEMADPFRQPLKLFKTLFNPIGSMTDKIKVGLLRLGLISTSNESDDASTSKVLCSLGFSESMRHHFWRPFLAGVFLEPDLKTSVRKFEEVFNHFASGSTAIPALGVAEIPKQLSECVDPGQLKLNTRVKKVVGQSLKLSSGKTLEAKVIVIATDFIAHDMLTEMSVNQQGKTGVACVYFAIDKPFTQPGHLVLNGDLNGPINNLMILPEATDCAPKGKYLLSVSVVKREFLDEPRLEHKVSRQLTEWYGSDVSELRHLKTYVIKSPVPSTPLPRGKRGHKIRGGLYRCGDYMGVPSLNTAMRSGRLVAEQIIREN